VIEKSCTTSERVSLIGAHAIEKRRNMGSRNEMNNAKCHKQNSGNA